MAFLGAALLVLTGWGCGMAAALRQQGCLLRDLPVAEAADVRAVIQNCALHRRQKSQRSLQKGRFAAAVRPEQHEYLPRQEVEADILNDGFPVVTGA